jgi:hypothetical protein
MIAVRRRGTAALLLLLGALLCPACEERPRFGFDFEQDRDLDELEWSCGALFRLSDAHATTGKRSLEMSLYPATDGDTEHYPGVAFTNFDPDWFGRRALVFDAHNPEAAPLPLEVRIDDRESPDYEDRFNASYTLAPGGNRVSIPLAALRTSGTKRPLRLGRIRTVALFLANPEERHTLFLDRVVLE